MAKYKGTIKFISDTNAIALVEELQTSATYNIGDTLLGTGDGVEDVYDGTLQPLIQEGSIAIYVDGVAAAINDLSLETAAGRTAMTSTGLGVITTGGWLTAAGLVTSTGYGILVGSDLLEGEANLICYCDGDLEFTFAIAPILTEKVTADYSRNSVSTYANATRLLRGDFSSYTVGSTIYYEYGTGAVEVFNVDFKRAGEV